MAAGYGIVAPPVGGRRGQLLTDGNSSMVRCGRGGELVCEALHGNAYEQASRGNVFASSTVCAPTQLGAYPTPFCLYNPYTSQKLLSLIRVEFTLPPSPLTSLLIRSLKLSRFFLIEMSAARLPAENISLSGWVTTLNTTLGSLCVT